MATKKKSGKPETKPAQKSSVKKNTEDKNVATSKPEKEVTDKPRRIRTRTTVTKPVVQPIANEDEQHSTIIAPTEELTADTNDSENIAPIVATLAEEEEIVASIIAPAEPEAPVTKSADKKTPAATTTNKSAGKEKVNIAQPKEQLTYLTGESPQNKQYAEQLRKHMSTMVNFLEEHKKKFNTYKETVDTFLKDNATPGFTYTYDAGAGILTGNYFGAVELKMPFTVTAHPVS